MWLLLVVLLVVPLACSGSSERIGRPEVWEERYFVPGLYEKRLAGDTSYLEPESATALMNCPAMTN